MLGVAIFFLLLASLNYSRVQFIETVHRLPILSHFDSSALGEGKYDLTAAAALATASGVLVFARRFPIGHASFPGPLQNPHKTGRGIWLAFTVSGFSLALIAMETIALVGRILPILSSLFGSPLPSSLPVQLEDQLSDAAGLVSAPTLLILAFSFLFRHHIASAFGRGSRKDGNRLTNVPDLSPANSESSQHRRPGFNAYYLIPLGAALAISSFFGIFAHLSAVNPTGSGVSTDEQYYTSKLSEMLTRSADGPAAVAGYAFTINGGDRPLSLLTLYLAGVVSGDSQAIPRYIPIALGPALVLSVYAFMVKVPIGDVGRKVSRQRAAIVALFAAFSPQIIAGIYGGFIANWFALIPGLASVLLLIKTWEVKAASGNNSKVALYSIAFFGLLVTTMLFHVYMWGHLIIVSAIFLAVSLAFYRKSTSDYKLKAILIAIAIVASIGMDVAKAALVGLPPGITRDEVVAGYSFNLDNFGSRWQTITSMLENYLGGFLVIPAMVVLALMWAVGRARMSQTFDRFLLTMLFVLAIPLLFGDMTIQARLLYNVPLFIPAALAVYGWRDEWSVPSKSILVLLIVISANYAIRSLSNLDLVLPPGVVLDRPFLAP